MPAPTHRRCTASVRRLSQQVIGSRSLARSSFAQQCCPLEQDLHIRVARAGDAANGTLTAAQYDPHSPDPVASELLAEAEEYLDVDEVPLNFAYAHDAINMIAGIIADQGLTGSDETLAADRVAGIA